MTTEQTPPWARLASIVEARRKYLHLSQEDVLAAGGPSISWQTNLRKKTEPLGVRHKVHLDKLDRVLLWDEGTSRRLLTQDRSGWSAALLEDEEVQLVEGHDRIGHIAFMVEQRLRALQEDHPEQVEVVARRILMAAGLPVVGD